MRRIVLTAGLVVALGAPACRSGGGDAVTVDGVAIAKAISKISVESPVTDYREGTDTNPCPHLLSGGCSRYGVCVISPEPVSTLDAQLPQSALTKRTHLTVGVEDGRQFLRCLFATLKVDGIESKRKYTYCLRCEDVTTPGG